MNSTVSQEMRTKVELCMVGLGGFLVRLFVFPHNLTWKKINWKKQVPGPLGGGVIPVILGRLHLLQLPAASA